MTYKINIQVFYENFKFLRLLLTVIVVIFPVFPELFSDILKLFWKNKHNQKNEQKIFLNITC